jgi:hypothetical protein
MTGYGLGGPMTAHGTVFDAKEASVGGTGTGRMMMMGIGSYVLWLLIG